MWVLGWPQHLFAYSVCLAILSSVSVWLGQIPKRTNWKGRLILVPGIRELNPWFAAGPWQLSLFNLKWTGSRGGEKDPEKHALGSFLSTKCHLQNFHCLPKRLPAGNQVFTWAHGSISEWNLIGMFKILPPGAWVSCGWAVGFNLDSSTFVLCFCWGYDCLKFLFPVS